MTPTRDPLLHVEELCAHPAGRLPLWNHIGFDLRSGERLALVGPSGSGKTLLLRQLALLDPLPCGRIELEGRSPAFWTAPVYRSKVALVAQRPVTLPGTVEENLRKALQFACHRERAFHRERVGNWLGFLGREKGFLHQEADHLSGGEGQLLALLRSLQMDPTILLLDEPTASLDGPTTTRVEALLGLWLEGGERACVVTSHDDAQIRRFTNRRLELVP